MNQALVRMNDFARQWFDTGAQVASAVERVGQSGWYVLGREVSGFEQTLAEHVRLKHVVGCASGLDAIEIGLRVLGIAPGERVLTTPLSAFATTLAIVRAGGVPVFVDVDAHGLVDLDAAERAFESDASLRIFVPVHLFGHSLDLERLRTLKERFELRIVEDAAQAVGASWKDLRVGSVGQVAATSFYPTKNLGALGDGGAVFSDDDGLARRARSLRDYGQSAKYVHDELGLNSRLDELHAAILNEAFLPRLTTWTRRRAEIAHAYNTRIENSAVRPLGTPSHSNSVWHLFPVDVSRGERAALMKYLKERGIESGVHYPQLISSQKALKGAPHEVLGGLDHAEHLAAHELSLPIHPYLSDEDVSRVVDAVNGWRP